MKLTTKMHQKCRRLAFLLPFVLDLGRLRVWPKIFRARFASSPSSECLYPHLPYLGCFNDFLFAGLRTREKQTFWTQHI